MRAVNLLPDDRKKRERSGPKFTPIHGAAFGIVVGALALGYWGHSISGQAAQKAVQAEELEQQATQLTAQIEKAKAATAQTVSTYATDKALVSGLANARVNWSTVMINLARVAPADVALASMAVTAPTGDQTGAAASGGERPAAITLEASASSRTSAALFVARLAAIPGFVEPRINGGINAGGGAAAGGSTGTTTSTAVRYTFNVEIPVDDTLFGSGYKPAASTTNAPATTTTPTQP